MNPLDETKRLLEEINTAIAGYDPVLREKARDILLAKAFGLGSAKDPSSKTNGHSTFSLPWSEPSKIGLNILIDAWSPKTQSERALLGAYHLQHVLGYRGMTGRQIQNSLQRYGLRLTNVTVATSENTKTKPPRIRKMKIRGKKHNHYIVTTAGVAYVENKLNGIDGT